MSLYGLPLDLAMTHVDAPVFVGKLALQLDLLVVNLADFALEARLVQLPGDQFLRIGL